MILRIAPHAAFSMPYPQQYVHEVKLSDEDYTAEQLGEALLSAIELAHTHPAGPEHFEAFHVVFIRDEVVKEG